MPNSIDQLDLSSLIGEYKRGGSSSYNPRTLIKIIVYAYLCNIYSGRRMSKQLEENVYFMWLSGMTTPDFRTLNHFRSTRLKDQIDTIFTQVVDLLHKEGLVSLKVQYIDGTKIESVANKYTFVWGKNVKRYDTHFRNKLKVVLQQAQQVIQDEEDIITTDFDTLSSDELRDKLNIVREKVSKLDVVPDNLLSDLSSQKETVEKIKEYDDKREILGDRNSYSTQDIDATFMRMKEDHMGNGQLKPTYNVQIATENQFITNYGLFRRPGDTATLISFLTSFKNKYGIQSTTVVADAGYGSEQNYDYLETNNIDNFIKFSYFHLEQKSSFKNNIFHKDNLFYNKKDDFYICPMGQKMVRAYDTTTKSELGYESKVSVYRAQSCEGCPLRGGCHNSKDDRTITVNHNLERHKEKVRVNLNCFEGLYHRSKRPIEPEAVFGQIKFNHKFNRFLMKGLNKTSTEFGLVAIAHNIGKMAKLMKIA